MKKYLFGLSVLIVLMGSINSLKAQINDSITIIPIDTTISYLVQNTLIGDYISASNITYNMPEDSIAVGLFYCPEDSEFPLEAGLVFCTGDVSDIPRPVGDFASSQLTPDLSDPDIELATGLASHDAVIIEFDYIPFTNIMSFSYIFGSEEFPEYATGTYNDAFGFFVSGEGLDGPYSNNSQNIALMPETGNTVTISEIYEMGSGPYYVNNEALQSTNFVYDGFTQLLDAVVEVVPFTTYHIKLIVSDIGDASYDTGVLLKNNSFSSWPLQYFVNSTTIPNRSSNSINYTEEGNSIQVDIELPIVAKTNLTYNYSLLGAAENGVDYEALSGTITFEEGDLTSSIIINTLQDNEAEGTEDLIIVMDILNDTIHLNIDDNTTRLEHINKPTELNIHPNPASKELTVQNNNFSGEPYPVNVYNTSGKLVHTEIGKNNKVKIDLDLWPNGVYFVDIDDERIKFVKE